MVKQLLQGHWCRKYNKKKRMNIHIELPGGCSGKCSFCIAENAKMETQNYTDALKQLIEGFAKNPIHNQSISITGREPTESPYILDLLRLIREHKDKFSRVVMTTNGSQLNSIANQINLSECIDHINISRHHYRKSKRNKIFGINSEFITDDEIKRLMIRADFPESVTFVATMDKKRVNNPFFVYKFVNYCKKMGVKCHFRRDYNLSPWFTWWLAHWFVEEYQEEAEEQSCPVCRRIYHKINGVDVTWILGATRPEEIIESYDLIFKPDGLLYYDWNYKKPVKGKIIENDIDLSKQG